jgi:hypothetical protein
MTLMDEKVVRKDVERDTRQIHLEQTRRLVCTITDEARIAPENITLGLVDILDGLGCQTLPWVDVPPMDHVRLISRLILRDLVDLATLRLGRIVARIVGAVMSGSP